MNAVVLAQTIINSVVVSSIYMLVSVGLALSFGVLRMANFAHGEFFMIGAYVVYVLYGLAGWSFPLAVLLAMPFVALFGLATERLIFRPTQGNLLAGFMATAGLSFILQVLVGQIWGVGLPKSVPTPYMGAAGLAGVFVGWQRLIIIPCAIASLVALHMFLFRTTTGKAMRACVEDMEIAACQGISTRTMMAVAMGIAGASAGLAGALMAPESSVTPYMGHNVVLLAFIVVVVGGLANVQGAMIAAALLGFIHTFVTTLWDSTIGTMVGVAVMALTLIFKPSGLFGKTAQEAVHSESADGAQVVRLPRPKGYLLPALTVGPVALALLGVPLLLSVYQTELLILFMINLILVVSYRLITITGDWSFCHVVLMGVGAYAAALAAKFLGWPFWATLPFAGIVAGAVGYAIAFPLTRTRAFGFFIASLAFGEFIRLIWVTQDSVFGGSRGMINIPLASFAGIDLSGSSAYFYVTTAVALVCLAAMFRMERSRAGEAWKSVHSDPALARSIGIDVERYRIFAFAAGSLFAGIAGALLVHRLGAIDPKSFTLTTMMYLVIWVVIGGTTTFWGPIIGLSVATVLFEWTRMFVEWRPLIFGTILILFLIFLPNGLESIPLRIASVRRRLLRQH